MANTKSTTSKTGVTKTKKDDAKIAKLEQQVLEQQKQIEELMGALQKTIELTTAVPQSVADNKATDIGADEEILVVSLTPNRLNLTGDGGAVLFTFQNIYEEQYIDYSSLKEIVRLNRDMAKNGRFYIMDERAVSKLRLKNDYKSVLSPEELKGILKSNTNSAIELYKLANDAQKHTIIDMIKQIIFKGESVDFNLLHSLEELSGIKLTDVEDATQIEISK